MAFSDGMYDTWNSPEVNGAIKLEGESLERVVKAHEEFATTVDELEARAKAVSEGLRAEAERANEKMNLAIQRELEATPLSGLGPEQVEIDLDYAKKFGFAIARRRPPKSGGGLLEALSRALGAKGVDIHLNDGD